jgi:NADH-quinone oxidoreductase subunit C
MLEKLRAQLGEAIESAEEVGRELRLWVAAGSLVALARACKEEGFAYLADITAVDTGEELRAVYRLISFATGQHAVISVGAPRSGARLPSVTGVYRGAEWPEREVYDMFGVRFDGHPDLRRILLTDDWQGHPLLKSFVLGTESGHRGG